MGAIATEPTIDASGANEPIAAKLEQVAALLEEQGANQYRVRSWRMAAETVRALERPVTEILREEGAEGIDRLPGIGPVLVRAIREIVERGRLGMLDRLRGHAEPLSVLATVPGVGKCSRNGCTQRSASSRWRSWNRRHARDGLPPCRDSARSASRASPTRWRRGCGLEGSSSRRWHSHQCWSCHRCRSCST